MRIIRVEMGLEDGNMYRSILVREGFTIQQEFMKTFCSKKYSSSPFIQLLNVSSMGLPPLILYKTKTIPLPSTSF
ncbi:UNVERIFIED_CONTAM: hypothetical protein FKN15_033638 [Acipenser sinensis]